MLVMITLITVWALRQVNLSDYWVSHTRDIISHNQRLLSDLKDAESAERGYIITGDENYLQPYKVAADDIQPTLNELRQLTVDNPAQQQRLQKIDQLILQTPRSSRGEHPGLKPRSRLWWPARDES